MKYFLKALLPKYWIMLNDYSPTVDKWFKNHIKNNTLTIQDYDGYSAIFNGIECWVANYPYGFKVETTGTRPSRATIIQIQEHLEAHALGN